VGNPAKTRQQDALERNLFSTLSAEEFILRMHVDDHDCNMINRSIDVFVMRNLYCKLCAGYHSRVAFYEALKSLSEKGIIKLDVANDGQAPFQTSSLVDPANYRQSLSRVQHDCDIAEAIHAGSFKRDFAGSRLFTA
jgi:hypothetical protein